MSDNGAAVVQEEAETSPHEAPKDKQISPPLQPVVAPRSKFLWLPSQRNFGDRFATSVGHNLVGVLYLCGICLECVMYQIYIMVDRRPHILPRLLNIIKIINNGILLQKWATLYFINGKHQLESVMLV